MSLILGKQQRKVVAPSPGSEPSGFELSALEIAWVISVAVVGAILFLWGLAVGRLLNPVPLAKYLLAWSMFVGLVPLPLQVMRRKMPPRLRFVAGAAVHAYIIISLLVALAAGDAVTWEKIGQLTQWGTDAVRITLEGIGRYSK
jgi:hypothetical protein